MLKLEKTSHDYEVSVTFRSKEQFFTRSLVSALALAIAIHLVFILLFHVSPLKIRWNNTPTLPSIVESDIALRGDQAVLASISQDVLPNNILLKAPPPLPFLPESPLYSANRQLDYMKESHIAVNLFGEIEKQIYFPAFSQVEKAKRELISISIAGPLADKSLIQKQVVDPAQIKLFSKLNLETPRHLLYSVLMDERSGRIFWYESLQAESQGIDKIAALIIEGLEFATSSAFVTGGQIEIHFNPELASRQGAL